MTTFENLKSLATQAAESDFLWKLGMRIPSGNQARDICEKLSVPLADEKRVKAVLRLRQENPEILQEIRDDVADEGDNTMVEVIRGAGFFQEKAQPLFKTLVASLLKNGIVFESRCGGRTLQNLEENHQFDFTWRNDFPGCLTINTTPEGEKSMKWNIFLTRVVKIHPGPKYLGFKDFGFPNLNLQVSDSRAMESVKKFARAWEAKSKQLKGSRVATVTIIQDFA